MDGSNNDQVMALLQQLQGPGAGGMGGGPAPLCEFKAGRMTFDGRMVTPDRARGYVRVTRDPLQPGMVTFYYLNEAKEPVESLILFPDIAKFEKVKQSQDRVYLLEVQPEPRRLFFWMQEDDKEGDEERAKKCHNAINGVTEEASTAAPAGGAATATTN